MTRRGLGRGLDALLESTASAVGLHEVDVELITANPFQPRHEPDDDSLEELTRSVHAHGLLQPLVVRPEGDGFQLIAGERRWRAAKAAGLKTVPVVVREADPTEMLALALIENVQRSDLNPLETAEAYRRLMDEFDLTQQEVSKLVGKSRAAVANTTRLLALADPVRTLLAERRISEGHARALLAVKDPKLQLSLGRRAAAEGWSVRRLEAAVREATTEAAPMQSGPSRHQQTDPNTAEAVRKLEESLGTKVEIRRRGEAGRLVIHFYSEEELATLYDLLTESP